MEVRFLAANARPCSLTCGVHGQRRSLDALASLAALVTLVTAELVAATSVGLGVLAVETTEVLGDLASVATTLQQDRVLASGALQGELIEGDGTAASLTQKTSILGQTTRQISHT